MLKVNIDETAERRLFAALAQEINSNVTRGAIAAEVIASSTEHRFATGDDGRWADIKPESRRRRRVNKTAPPGTDTGAARAAATATRYGVANSAYRLDPTGLTMGVTGLPGMVVFQETRPFMLVTEQDRVRIVGDYEHYLTGRFGRIL